MSERLSETELFLNRIVEVARGVARQSGEPELEISGWFISMLHCHPEWIARFMAEGPEFVLEVGFSPVIGSLSYRARNGKILTPEEYFAKHGHRA